MCELGPNARVSSRQSVEKMSNESSEDFASQAEEAGIAVVEFRRQARWLAQNRGAMDSSNTFVERHGLPLANYRRF